MLVRIHLHVACLRQNIDRLSINFTVCAGPRNTMRVPSLDEQRHRWVSARNFPV